jgi:hypothetical protein
MKHVDTKGRLVLEDLPETLEEVGQLHPRIEQRPYNFFLPQPVTGMTVAILTLSSPVD